HTTCRGRGPHLPLTLPPRRGSGNIHFVHAMQRTFARVLEFDSLLDLLRGYAASDMGRARLAAMTPSADLAWIQNQHQLTAEIREFRRVGGNFNFAGLVETSELLEKARISGSALETGEILSVIAVVDRAAEWRAIAINPPQGMKQDWTAVDGLSSGIADFTEFLRSF